VTGLKLSLSMPGMVLRKAGIIGRYGLVRYREDWPDPRLTRPNQVLVEPLLSGICASDLHTASLDLSYFSSVIEGPVRPLLLGHEMVGRVAEIGPAVRRLALGDRVVFFPLASCRDRGVPPCPACRQGNPIACRTVVGGDGEEADLGGWNGGAFCSSLAGFEGQFFRVPPSVPDACAVMVEPFAVGLHAVARHLPEPGDTVLVIGAGTIGLMVIAALRLLTPRSRILCLARHPFQQRAARRLGASLTIADRDGERVTARVAELTGAAVVAPMMQPRAIYGNAGPDIVFDTVGTEETLGTSLRLARSNGRVVVVGMGSAVTRRTDWALQVYKELTISGSMAYGRERSGARAASAFEIALGHLAEHPRIFRGLVTHTFPPRDWRAAFACARGRSRTGAIKVAFDWRG
jgi:L-iditol 2-dehydrogenase